MATNGHRAAIIADLRRLADLLDADPDLPMPLTISTPLRTEQALRLHAASVEQLAVWTGPDASVEVINDGGSCRTVKGRSDGFEITAYLYRTQLVEPTTVTALAKEVA